MERETELTQSWSPELSALNDDDSKDQGGVGGLLKGAIPVQVSGEMRTFSLPLPQDVDDGTDISLKDWQLSDHPTSAPSFAIKPFKGTIRSRFTPVEPRLDEDIITSPRGGGQSSPEHFETPTTTPRMSSSGTRSSSVSPSQSVSRSGDNQTHVRPGIAFDISSTDDTPPDEATSALRSRSLRVSFKDNSNRRQRPSVPVVRHRSPLRSRSILPTKEVKVLQPKWESSTRIRPEKATNSPSSTSKPTVQAPRHGIKLARKAGTKPAAANRARAVVAPELVEPELGPEINQSSSGYLSEGRYSGRHSGRDSGRESLGHQEPGGFDEYGSNRLSRELTMSPVHRSERKEFETGRSAISASLSRKRGGHRLGGDVDDSEDEEDVTKGGILCGGGLSDTKLSGDFVRLLSKLCRVSVPKQQASISKSVSLPHSKGRSRSIATALSWDSSAQNSVQEESRKVAVIGRQDSLKLLSERCSDAPAPSYSSHKSRKIRNHEPHQHFYRTISKTLDRKLRG